MKLRMLLWVTGLGAALGAAPVYPDHSRLLVFRDGQGVEHPVATPKEWAPRRAQILAGMQEAMGPLPDRTHLPPLDVRVSEETKADGFTRQALSFVAEGADRIPAHLSRPTTGWKGKRRSAGRALNQPSPSGKRDPAGQGKNPNV